MARNFQPAPELPGVQFLAPNNPLLNAQGQVVFQTTLIGAGITSSNNETVWLWSPIDRSLTLVWREGSAVPGTVAGAPAGVTFGGLIQSPAVNANGQVLIHAFLRDTGEAGNDRGVYATEANGQGLFKVVAEGDAVQVAPGDVRTITFLNVHTGTGGEDGRPSGLNDAGQVAFQALFANEFSSRGVLVADTNPAPAQLPTANATL